MNPRKWLAAGLTILFFGAVLILGRCAPSAPTTSGPSSQADGSTYDT